MNITIVISLIAGLSWIVVIALLVVTVVRASRRQSIKGTVTAFVLAVIVAVLLNTISAASVFRTRVPDPPFLLPVSPCALPDGGASA